MSDDGFKLVTYKKCRNSNKINRTIDYRREINIESDIIIKRIEEAKKEISTSDLYDSVLASLHEGFVTLNQPIVNEIICFGLGRISDCLIARYQFALLLCLKDYYKNISVACYDPIFTNDEIQIIEQYGCRILKTNCEGKYKINETTIFYLPHCSKQLTNNLLWSNWGLNLTKCVIISNSFNQICDNIPKHSIDTTTQYIQNILPYVVELAIINSFRFYEIFNDTALHVFPLDKINLIAQDFWTYCDEPIYSDDIEFIKNH